MLNKLNIFILIIISVTQVFAQSGSFTISWDLNTESDIYNYLVYRSTSPGAANQIATIQHPSNEFTDTNVEKGVQYYYRLRATDISMNQSAYSEEISAAIPLISGIQSQVSLQQQGSFQLQLDDHVFDPDNADDTIVWTVSGNTNINVNITNRVATITAPQSWSGQEQITFSAADPFGFSDQFSITVIVESNDSPFVPPVFAAIPAQQLNEDSEITIDLADYVTDTDSDINELTFSVQTLNVMSLSINGSILRIDPTPNWSGQRTVSVTVTDSDNNSDQMSFSVTVNPVNDAPVLSQFPSQVIKQDTAIVFNLAAFVTDIDNNISDLAWDISGEGLVNLSFNDASDGLTISSVGSTSGFDYIVITVSDPDNASARDTLTVRVVADEIFPPQIVNLPDVTFNEDDSIQLSLNDYVLDGDDPVENLFWHTGTDENVRVNINPQKNIATFRAKHDWYGETTLWFIVQDPDQNMASDQIKIVVNPVNDRPSMRPLPNLNLSDQLTRQINLANFSSDVDDDVNTLSWTTNASQNVAVEIAQNGIATFSVDDTWQGQETVEIYVSDLQGSRDTSATIVYRQNQQVAPQINLVESFTIAEDNQGTLNLADFISDPDNSLAELEINFSNNKNSDVTINMATNEMTIIPDANWNGTEHIYIQVLDPANNVAFDTLTVIISPVNDEPFIKNIGTITLLENTTSTIELMKYIIEYDGLDDIVEINLLGGNNGFFGYYLDKENFQLTFFAPTGFFGRETYLLRIKDSQSIEASTVFTVNVLEKSIRGGVAVNYFGNETNMNMYWDTYTETKDYIEYGINTDYGAYSDAEDDYKVNHNHILSGLEEHTTYHFRIVSETLDGNMTYSADSVFTTGSSSGREINVFPIPYQESKDNNKNGISFTNLPVNSKLNIYNLLGEPVFMANELNTTYRWDVRSNAGNKLSSGLYMYVINNEKNKKISSGKVIIVR